LKFEIISGGPVEVVGPGVNDRIVVEVVYGGRAKRNDRTNSGSAPAAARGY
jgi:hypothetical protein